jgi:L-rhamnose mutarotase
MPRLHVLTLDLHDDPALIERYEQHHRAVWPEVEQAIRRSGIRAMTIHRLDDRLVMVVEAEDDFSFERKAAIDAANPVVQRWEALMEQFQKVTADGRKWREMTPIYALPR